MLKIRTLHAKVEARAILNGINLAVNAGEVHSTMGPKCATLTWHTVNGASENHNDAVSTE